MSGTAGQPPATSSRLAAIDVARALALIGMMATHVLPNASAGASAVAHEVAGGRSSALFAVLAGVGLGLLSGGAEPDPGRLAWARRATLIRAGMIAVIGLGLGELPTPAAIILCYYAALFVLSPPVLGWPFHRLAVAALAWAVLSPVASQWVRSRGIDGGPGPNLAWTDLREPADAARHLLVTGYYPVLTWISYLLLGLAIGRLPLARPDLGRRLALAGVAVAATGWLIGEVTLGAGGTAVARADAATFHGTGGTDSWWWLGVRAPHTGEIGDLLHTAGTSMLVIGLALVAVPRLGVWTRPLAAAGSMTLTLYSVHVVALAVTDSLDPAHRTPAWPLLAAHVAVALAVATWWGSPTRRGPLEELVAATIEVAVGSRPRGEAAA